MEIILVIIVLLIIYAIVIYNKFIILQANLKSSNSDINAHLKRRYNLIPALLKTVKSYMKHESKTFDEIVKARNNSYQPKNNLEAIQVDLSLNQSLGNLFALTENYPELKADISYKELQTQLATIENDIQNARRYYNAIAAEYNAKLNTFPEVLIANNFNFKVVNYFELEDTLQAQMPIITL
jgi:LemA protein